MGDGMLLLRMLEPPVRPDGVNGRAVGSVPPRTPIESRPFDSILSEARALEVEGLTIAKESSVGLTAGGNLGSLRTLDEVAQIENQMLRRLLADQHVSTRKPTPAITTRAGGIEE